MVPDGAKAIKNRPCTVIFYAHFSLAIFTFVYVFYKRAQKPAQIYPPKGAFA